MPLIALDVAILPPPDVARRAIELSAGLRAEGSQGLRLGPDYLPHVTLLQLFVSADDLSALLTRVEELLRMRSTLTLRVSGGDASGRSVWMGIERTSALVDLHLRLLDAAQPFEQPGGDFTAFFGGDARDRDVRWVTFYRTASSGASFRPHITLGYAARPAAIAPFDFEATTVAACHLGRFCTCRRVLHEWSLARDERRV